MRAKERAKLIGKNIFECFKRSFSSSFMYFMAGTILMMLTMTGDVTTGLTAKRWTWTVVCIVAAAAYNAFVAYVCGGNHYEMLVSGNMKRVSAMNMGSEFKISSHKIEKEYRIWKGFGIGAFIALFAVIGGIVFGANQSEIAKIAVDGQNPSKAVAVFALIFFCLSGWSVLPFFYANAAGAGISYYWSCLMGLLPLAIYAGMYIAGAYGRRRKSIKAQELADRAAAAQAEKPKKINYGGLPGTKPKKRK
ncbi:MAG: hypothetical protein IJ506_04230 [Clostridia bacterium]|nr:hypothetical protein [Clostridia bacterium]